MGVFCGARRVAQLVPRLVKVVLWSYVGGQMSPELFLSLSVLLWVNTRIQVNVESTSFPPKSQLTVTKQDGFSPVFCVARAKTHAHTHTHTHTNVLSHSAIWLCDDEDKNILQASICCLSCSPFSHSFK